MSGAFISSSFYPFFPCQQGQQRKKTIKPQDGLTENQPIENNPESILKLHLSKGEIIPEAYSYLRKLLSK
jgi:hypothetical protein